MITSFLLLIIYGFIWAITSPLRLLPDTTLPANIVSAIASANSYLSAIDFIFPTGSFVTIFATIIGIEVLIMLYKIIMWIIRKIPGIN
jgi:hypothetical protein